MVLSASLVAATLIALALKLLAGEFADGDTVLVDAREGELVFEKAAVAAPATA